jgi:hypothetical protein
MTAVLHDHQAVAEGHGLLLVVGHVEHRRAGALVQGAQLAAHLDAQLGVEVGERLVEQEHLGVAHQGATHGDSLALAAGEFLGLALQEVVDAQGLGGLFDLGGDRGGLFAALLAVVARGQGLERAAVLPPALQAEGQVSAHGHVRVERVVLEHHGDVPVAGGDLVHHPVADGQGALGDLLEPGDHAQGGALAAARGADQHHEFTVGDVEVHALDGAHAAVVDLADGAEFDLGHGLGGGKQGLALRGASGGCLNRVSG